MPIAFTCSGCGKPYEVSDALAGKTGRCKQCGSQFQIPTPRSVSAQPPPASAPSEPPLRSLGGSPQRPSSPGDLLGGGAAAPRRRPEPAPSQDDLFGDLGPPASKPSRPGSARPGGSGEVLDEFEEADVLDEVPLASGAAPRGSRYRTSGTAGPAAASGKPDRPKPKRKSKAGGGLSIPSNVPLPALILGGGGTLWALFLLVVVLPSMQANGGNNAAPAAPAPPVNRPDQAAFGGAAAVANAPPAQVAAAPEGFPALPALPPNLVPEDQQGPIEDISRHEAAMRKMIGALDRLADLIGSVRDENTFRAAQGQLPAIQQEVEAAQRDVVGLLNPSPRAGRVLARRVVGEATQVSEKLRQNAQKLAAIPGLGGVGMQMQSEAGMMSAGLQPLIQAANAGSQPYVEVFISGVDDGDAGEYMRDRLIEMADPAPAGAGHQAVSVNRSSALRLWPVSDVQSFANRIDFGQATVSGRQVTVQARPIDPALISEHKAKKQQAEEDQVAQIAAARPPQEPQIPPDADAVDKALILLKTGDHFKKKEAAQQLAVMIPADDRRDEVVEALEPVATGTDHFPAIEAVKALANWKNERAVKILCHVIERSDDGFVRGEAEKQLGKLKEPSAAEVIASRINDDWPASHEALRSLGEVAEPALIDLLRDGNPRARTAACEILRDVGGKAALDAMKKLPADSDLGVRNAARVTMQALNARVRAQGSSKP